MGDWVREAREWWESADSDTRYLVIVAASGFFSLSLMLLEKGSTRETFHRVRIEGA